MLNNPLEKGLTPLPMQLFNTLKQSKEPLSPLVPGKVGIYVCGPTVYDFAHVGHARCYITYDILVRFLRFTGLDVRFVRNVTDVNDKILNRAQERKEEPGALADKFYDAFAEDMRRIGNIDPDVEPRVSENIPEIIALIERLIAKGAAYASDGDVYFHVDACKDYGKLSHRNADELEAGASGRTEDEELARKKDARDFALWKGAPDDDWAWESPWGRGRPGWHIECSAMSMKELGETFDIHGGGLDLVFPHHENEIAQSETATCKPYVNCWIHNGFVQVNKEKMSKSLGNFFGVRDVFEKVEPEALRLGMFSCHYRVPLNLDWSQDESGKVTGFPRFEEAEQRLVYLYKTLQRFQGLPEKRKQAPEGQKAPKMPDAVHGFVAGATDALNDDLNLPIALAKMVEFLRGVNEMCDRAMSKGGKIPPSWVAAAERGFAFLRDVMGFGSDVPAAFLSRVRDRRALEMGVNPADIQAQIQARIEARKAKDYGKSDEIRDALLAMGVKLFDAAGGAVIGSWCLQMVGGTRRNLAGEPRTADSTKSLTPMIQGCQRKRDPRQFAQSYWTGPHVCGRRRWRLTLGSKHPGWGPIWPSDVGAGSARDGVEVPRFSVRSSVHGRHRGLFVGGISTAREGHPVCFRCSDPVDHVRHPGGRHRRHRRPSH